MKTAIIYTGHLRTWEKCRPNHQANLWRYGGNDASQHYFHTYGELPDYCDQDMWIPIPAEYYYIIDHPYNANRRPEISIGNTLNQWHNNFIGFCLTPATYDVYVRCRPDIIFSDRVPLTVTDDNTVYIPHGNDYYGGINDQFAYGSYKAMKAYYSIYLNHAAIFADGMPFHTEEYVTENLRRCGIAIQRLTITNSILRA